MKPGVTPDEVQGTEIDLNSPDTMRDTGLVFRYDKQSLPITNDYLSEQYSPLNAKIIGNNSLKGVSSGDNLDMKMVKVNSTTP